MTKRSLSPSYHPRIKISQVDHEFKEEFSGRKKYKIRKDVEAECDHGPIVNDQAYALKGLGCRVGNDINRDLYIINSEGEITTVFEIKTDMATSSLYSAVGQLLLNNVSLSPRPRLIIVSSEKIGKDLEAKLNLLGIELLTFSWRDDKAVFPKLNSLITNSKSGGV